jgi:hypothetical protein
LMKGEKMVDADIERHHQDWLLTVYITGPFM